MHRFISAYRPPGRELGKESQARLHSALKEAMALLDDIIHVLARSSLALLRYQLVGLQVARCTDVGRVHVDVNHPWDRDVFSSQYLSEESIGCSSTSRGSEEETQCVAGLVYSTIQVNPLTSDLDVGFVKPPGVVALLQVRTTPYIYF